MFRASRVLRRRFVVAAVLIVFGGGAATISAIASAASTPPTFLISPIAMNFGYVPVGSTSPEQVVKVTNVSKVSQDPTPAGGAAGVFGGSTNCGEATLAPGASCQFYYAFSPTSTGAVAVNASGSMSGQSFSFRFVGTGTPQFLITPTSLDFGDVKVGTTSPKQVITVKNVSNGSVVPSAAGGAGGVFGGSTNCGEATLAPGASCQFYYAFSPASTGVTHASAGGSVSGQPFSFTFVGNGVS